MLILKQYNNPCLFEIFGYTEGSVRCNDFWLCLSMFFPDCDIVCRGISLSFIDFIILWDYSNETELLQTDMTAFKWSNHDFLHFGCISKFLTGGLSRSVNAVFYIRVGDELLPSVGIFFMNGLYVAILIKEIFSSDRICLSLKVFTGTFVNSFLSGFCGGQKWGYCCLVSPSIMWYWSRGCFALRRLWFA
jgi:hypothetical protein